MQLVLGALFGLVAAQPTTGSKFLLIVADDLGVDAVGAYGEGAGASMTPTLDRLAGGGVLFRRAYAAPVCSPSRAMLLTGRYGGRTGIGRALSALEDGAADPCAQHELLASETTLAELLASSPRAFATAAIGKWHLNAACASNGDLDVVRVRGGFGHYDGALANFNPRSNGPASSSSYFCYPRIVDGALDCGDSCCPGDYQGGLGSNYRGAYATTDSVDAAIAWIGARPSAQPWLCYLAFHAAHGPLQAPPAELHSQPLTIPVGAPGEGEPVPPGTIAFEYKPLGVVVDARPYFAAMVEALDREIGRLLATLPDDVTVIVIGDNGSDVFTVQPPFDPRHGKETLYEGGIRVPLIVSGPSVAQPGRETDALVSAVDVLATVAELAQVELPAATLDSRSFADVLFDASATARPFVFSQYFEPNADPLGPPVTKTVEAYVLANARYKLIDARSPKASLELYDLELDPFEQCDRIAAGDLTVAEQQNLALLQAMLQQHLASFP